MSKAREPSNAVLANDFEDLMGQVDVDMSQAKLARKIGCKYSTLRTWFKRKAFPRNEAEAIADAVGMSRSKLNGYGPENFTKPTGRKPNTTKATTSFPDAVEALDQLCSCSYSRRSPEAEAAINSAVRTMIDTMGAECFWFSTTRTMWPKLLNPPGPKSLAAIQIYGALSRGMRLAFIIPTANHIAEINSRYASEIKGLEGITPYQRFVTYFNHFKLGYADFVGGRDKQESIVQADTRLQLFEADDFLVTPAQTAVNLFGKARGTGHTRPRILLESATDDGDGLLLAAENDSYHRMAMTHASHFVGRALRDGGWYERTMASGLSMTPDREEAIRLRAGFIETILQDRRGSNAPPITGL